MADKTLSMAMSSNKRKAVIINADTETYFNLLDEQRRMSRNERSALRNRGLELYAAAKEDKSLRDKWNKAAAMTGHKDRQFHVSVG